MEAKKAGVAHLSDQRGVRAGAQERGDRHRHHVEGARGAVAERRHQRRVGRADEGVPMYVSGFVIPKNAPNKDGGYAYMNAMLEKSAQENFAIDMGYNPTVTNATVAPTCRSASASRAEEQ